MLYKYCKEIGFDILENCRLKYNKIDDFNDPFEIVFGIDDFTAPNNITKEFRKNPDIIKLWTQELEKQNISFNKTSPEDILEKFIQYIINDFENAKEGVRRDFNNKFGIICFSESPVIIQMWSHYSENHQGIVVGIDENMIADEKDKIHLHNVHYQEKMTLFQVSGIRKRIDQNALKCFHETIRRKQTDWSYEKEVRIYLDLDENDKDRDSYFKKIPASSIREIYLGLGTNETSVSKAKNYKQKEEYKHLKLYRMNRHKSEYKLVPKEIL